MSVAAPRRFGLTGKELVFKVLRHEDAPAVPWVPFAGVHVAFSKGYSAREVLTNGDALLESLLEANRLYVRMASRWFSICRSRRKFWGANCCGPKIRRRPWRRTR